MTNKLPSFQDFLEYSAANVKSAGYDLRRLSPKRLKEPGNPFSQEEYTILTQTCMTIALTHLCQYHCWLCEQISKTPDDK